MADYFKRRSKPGPTKNELKVRRSQEAADQTRSTGSLSHDFPSVRSLSVRLEFLTPAKQPLDSEVREFKPSDSCEFTVPCPGRCGSGSFDLAAKIRSVIEAGETLSESTGTCQQPISANPSDVCGFMLRCRLEVSYN